MIFVLCYVALVVAFLCFVVLGAAAIHEAIAKRIRKKKRDE